MPERRLQADSQTMFQLKLEAPRKPSSLVDRPRLIAALNAIAGCRLVLLCAPAGFGKTTLLSQWRDHCLERDDFAAWLTLDEADADAHLFLGGVIRSLSAAGLQMGGMANQAEHGLNELTVDGILHELVALIERSDRQVLLLLDDYHRAANPLLDRLLDRLILLLPNNCQLVMSTRQRPDIAIVHLLGSGAAVEMTGDMLRFTTSESRQILGLEEPDRSHDGLMERIEGWPVALQLARLLTLQQQAGPAALARLSSRGGHLWAFLTDQVLNGLDNECVDFLLDTSILEKFSAEITDAMRERTDSWRIMARLEPLQSLLTPLDSEDIWYRYHHLFAEYLQVQLRQRRPSAVGRLHLNASRAFERAGLLVEAVRHAGLAGDYQRCAELVEHAGGWRLVLFGGMAHLNQLLDCIPRAERLSHPRLLLAEAYVHLKMGRIGEARSTFDLVGRDVTDLPSEWAQLDDVERDVLNIGVLIRTYEDNRIDLPFVDFFNVVRSRLPHADGLTRGVFDCGAAVAHLGVGKLEVAEDLARQAMTGMREANSVLGLNYCFLHAGLACAYRGELRSALAYLQRARAMAVENFGSDSGLKAIAETLLAMVQLWCDGRPLVTDEELDESFRHVCDYDGWFEIYAAGLDSRFRLAVLKRDLTAMDRVIADGEVLTRERSLIRLGHMVEAQRLLRHCFASDHAGADAAATTLLGHFPLGAWRDHPASWRPYQDVGLALVTLLLKTNVRQACTRARDVLECAEATGATLYAVRAQLLLARAENCAARQYQALVHLRSAVSAAAREAITLPFLEQSELLPLFRQLKRDLWDSGAPPIEASFLSGVEERLAAAEPNKDSPMAMLSAREQEVIVELSRGLTNKEIARALDMTDNTVKFHLKNIFSKLGVDRRAHALTVVRDFRSGNHL